MRCRPESAGDKILDSAWPRFRTGMDPKAFSDALLDVLHPDLRIILTRTTNSHVFENSPRGGTFLTPVSKQLRDDILGPLSLITVERARNNGSVIDTRVFAKEAGGLDLWRMTAVRSRCFEHAWEGHESDVLDWLRDCQLPERTRVGMPTTQHARMAWMAQNRGGMEMIPLLLSNPKYAPADLWLFRDGPVTALFGEKEASFPIAVHV